MDVHDLVLPKFFASVRMTLWLPGEWPCLAELMDQRRGAADYAQRRWEWMETVKRAIRAGARVPLLDGDVAVGFWHHRAHFDRGDRTEYSRTAESFILPPLVRTGAFRETALRAVTHLFDAAEPSAAGIYVLVSEYPVAEVEPAGPVLGLSAIGRPIFAVSPPLRRVRARRPAPGQLGFGF